MALATLTFPTTFFFFVLGILLRNRKEVRNDLLLGVKKKKEKNEMEKRWVPSFLWLFLKR